MTELSTINLGKIEAMKQALMIYCFFFIYSIFVDNDKLLINKMENKHVKLFYQVISIILCCLKIC